MARILTGPLSRAIVVENPSDVLDGLLEQHGFQVERLPKVPTEDELIADINRTGAQVVFKRSRMPITRRLVEACPSLVSVQLCSIGDDSVDKEACAEHGILVFNDPISNARSVVELFVSELIGMARRLHETVPETLEGNWEKSAVQRYEIKGKYLGVLGLGNIGRQVARVAELLGMKIAFYDSRIVATEVGAEMGWTQAPSMEALFEMSDAVTVHVSANDIHGNANDGLITRDLLMALGRNRPENSPRIFLNLSRGFLHEPADLLAAIDEGAIRRAAVDVYPEEPGNNGPGWPNPYGSDRRIVATPHIGAATQEAQPRIARRVAFTTGMYSRFGNIRDCVFAPRTTISMSDGSDGLTMLLVLHSTARGTKKALDDAIYDSGAANLRSEHRDFSRWGLAVDANLIDKPLSNSDLESLVERTKTITGDENAVRLIRQVPLGG